MTVHYLLKTALSVLLSLTVATATAQQIKLVNALASTLGQDYQIVESVTMGGTLYFSTKDDNSTALWKTDGSTTSMLYKWTYRGDYTLNKLYVLNGNQLLFTGFDSAHGKELWTSDGTVAGTKLLKDIVPGPDGPFGTTSTLNVYFGLTHQAFALKDGYAYFCASADPADTGNRLWRTDGTMAGTQRVPDFINLARTESFGPNVGLTNNKLILSYFANQSTNNGRVSTDGTTAGTTVFGATNSDERYFPCNGKLLFRQGGLAITDGTITGTATLDSFHTFSSGDIVAMGGKVYYFFDSDLWTTDGTPGGTYSIASSLLPNGFSATPTASMRPLDDKRVQITMLGGKLYFIGAKATVWTSDGTMAGTKPFVQFPTVDSFNSGGGIYKLTTLGGKLYFRGVDSFRVELYESDGTLAGTRKLLNPAGTYQDMRFDYWNNPAGPGRFQPYVDEIMTVNNKILFTALYDSSIGKALYSLDMPTAVAGPQQASYSPVAYPNPTPGHLSLSYPENQFSDLYVSDVMGRVVFRQPANADGKQELDLNRLSKGTYFIRLSGLKETIGTSVILR